MTVHIQYIGSDILVSPALAPQAAEQLWADFQRYLQEEEPAGSSYALANGRQELAVRFAAVASISRTMGAPGT